MRKAAVTAKFLLAAFALTLVSACAPKGDGSFKASFEEPAGFLYHSFYSHETRFSEKPLSRVHASAMKGDEKAMTLMGELALGGEKYNEAVSWFIQAAQENYLPAIFLAGEYLPDSNGLVPAPEATGVEFLKLAAEQGEAKAPARYLRRLAALKGHMPQEDYARWLPAVLDSFDLDDIAAMASFAVEPADKEKFHSSIKVAWDHEIIKRTRPPHKTAPTNRANQWLRYLLYENGIGVPKNAKAAARHRANAVAANVPEALYATYRAKGASAAALLEKAAEQGYLPAILLAAQCYQNGEGGFTRNLEKAVALYKGPAEKGNVAAALALAELLTNGQPEMTPEAAASEATAWWEKAARLGSEKACRILSTRYAEGLGTAKDPAAAAYWERVAASEKQVLRQYKAIEATKNVTAAPQ